MFACQQPEWTEQKGQTLTGTDSGLEEKELMSAFMPFTLQPDVSMQPWETGCQTTYFIFIRSKKSISKPNIPKQIQMVMGWK